MKTSWKIETDHPVELRQQNLANCCHSLNCIGPYQLYLVSFLPDSFSAAIPAANNPAAPPPTTMRSNLFMTSQLSVIIVTFVTIATLNES